MDESEDEDDDDTEIEIKKKDEENIKGFEKIEDINTKIHYLQIMAEMIRYYQSDMGADKETLQTLAYNNE